MKSESSIPTRQDATSGLRHTARSQEIVRTAAELWAATGYHGTGIEELSNRLGIRSATLYYHIGTKEALLHEIGLDAIRQLLDETVDDPTKPAAVRIRELSRVLLSNIAREQSKWSVFFREMGWLSGERRAEIFTLREGYEDLWASVITDGISAGDFRNIDPVITKGILGLHNYAYLWINGDGRLGSDEISDIFMDLILGGLDASLFDAGHGLTGC